MQNALQQEENKHEDIFLIRYSDHKRTLELGYEVEIRNLLANNRLFELEILLDNLGVEFLDLRKKRVPIN